MRLPASPNISTGKDGSKITLIRKGGEPGAVLFSKVIEDSRNFAPATNFTLNFIELDLSNEGIGVLPDVVHIAYGNAGSDDNLLTIGPAPYATENVSHLYVNSAWIPLWDAGTTSGDSFDKTVVPIRARFRLEDTRVDIEREILPKVLVLHDNYPNPFRQSTHLVFDLHLPARVTVEVMDMVGRRVLTVPPVDVATGWNNHIALDGQSLAAGHYLYRMVVSSAEGTSTHTGHFVRIR